MAFENVGAFPAHQTRGARAAVIDPQRFALPSRCATTPSWASRTGISNSTRGIAAPGAFRASSVAGGFQKSEEDPEHVKKWRNGLGTQISREGTRVLRELHAKATNTGLGARAAPKYC